ncbi:MAG: hypothetical protein HS128_20595 [Ideonella sp.]|nr:hypothetical protein [Ideonella sp.]MCC7458909.1 hypothetical protein [Nitrospira sp.]
MRTVPWSVTATIAIVSALMLLRVGPHGATPHASASGPEPLALRIASNAVRPAEQPIVRPGDRTSDRPSDRTSNRSIALAPTDTARPRSSHAIADGDGLHRRVEQLLLRGTPRDRYQAFAVLARCAHAVDFDRHLNSLPPGSETARLRERYGNGSARIASACGDLSARDVQRRVDLAAAAADDGVPGAAAAWIEEGPFGDRSALTQRPDDPLVVAWVAEAIERVRAATRHADTEAIGQYGLLCLNWELDDTSRVRLLVDAGRQRRQQEQLAALLN